MTFCCKVLSFLVTSKLLQNKGQWVCKNNNFYFALEIILQLKKTVKMKRKLIEILEYKKKHKKVNLLIESSYLNIKGGKGLFKCLW